MTATADNRFDRSLRFAALASQGDWLKPPHPDADAVIGDLAFRSPLEATLVGHQSYIWSATFSPDGTAIVTASWDRTARVWREGEDGAWASTVLVGHEDDVNSAAFSPDGTRVVTTSDDGTARVWREGEDGVWASTPLEGHEDWVNSAAFSPDGRAIVTASGDATARVWDVRYLAGPGDWAAGEPRPRAVAICEERMSNSLFEGKHPDRLITEGDAEAYPALRGRVGEDVCDPLINPPPWWHALAFWE